MARRTDKRAKLIELGAKYFAPRAAQRLGMATAEDLAALDALVQRGEDEQFTECLRQANAIGLRVASFAIHELLAHLDEVAVEGSGLALHHPRCGADFTPSVALPANPTFRQLAHAADKLIEQSDDLHHCFIEGFHYDPATGVIELSCGS
jgi:hypothetical protein